MGEESRYSINLDEAFGPLQLVDVAALAGPVEDRWFNQTLVRSTTASSGSASCRASPSSNASTMMWGPHADMRTEPPPQDEGTRRTPNSHASRHLKPRTQPSGEGGESFPLPSSIWRRMDSRVASSDSSSGSRSSLESSWISPSTDRGSKERWTVTSLWPSPASATVSLPE